MQSIAIGLAASVVCLAAGGLVYNLIAAPDPTITPRDVFGFASLAASRAAEARPPLQRDTARDGEALAWRFYDSPTDRILIFLHGSSYHGGGYHALAAAISGSGAAKVVLPNLRGHYQSGRRRGDVAYIGQLEDDLADLIGFLRTQGMTGPIVLGGHSSGGGLAIRFAGGGQAGLVSRYLLLSPVIPASAVMRGGDAGGWAVLNMQRLYGLLFLNMIGLHALDGLPVIAFSKPPEFWDGTETLSYSYRLNASYHPRFRYAADMAALRDRALVLVGTEDEAIDPGVLQALMTANAPRSQVTIVPGLNHFALFSDPAALQTIEAWLRAS